MFTIRTILHPTDFSGPSCAAFRVACSLAREHGARLVVLHVLPPPVACSDTAASVLEPVRYWEEQAAKLRGLCPADAATLMEHQLAEGDPATEILHVAGERGCDLIVMGTHGRTGLKHLLFGSVAEAVLRRAACPVLTVKVPNEAAPEAKKAREVVTAGSP